MWRFEGPTMDLLFKGILLGFQKLNDLIWGKNALTMEVKGP